MFYHIVKFLSAMALVLITMALLTPTWVRAQTICGNHATMVTSITDNYGETRQSSGLSGGEAIYELYANIETGTWTILRTTTDRVTCAMAFGDGYANDEPTTVPDTPA